MLPTLLIRSKMEWTETKTNKKEVIPISDSNISVITPCLTDDGYNIRISSNNGSIKVNIVKNDSSDKFIIMHKNGNLPDTELDLKTVELIIKTKETYDLMTALKKPDDEIAASMTADSKAEKYCIDRRALLRYIDRCLKRSTPDSNGNCTIPLDVIRDTIATFPAADITETEA